jgi:uncharacterized membrane protein
VGRAADPGERAVVVRILRGGLWAFVALTAVGLALAWGSGLRARPVAPGQVPAALLAGRPEGFLAGGVLVLLGTQAARLVALAARFAGEGDRRFAAVAAAVALVLAAGAALGRS